MHLNKMCFIKVQKNYLKELKTENITIKAKFKILIKSISSYVYEITLQTVILK